MVDWLTRGKRYSCIRYPLRVKWFNGEKIRKGLSLRTILRSCEQKSEAILSKSATAMNYVRDSSFC